MGDRFVGSNDYTLATNQLLGTSIIEGAWVDLEEAEIHELDITLASNTDNVTLKIETDMGIAGGVQQVHEAFSEVFGGNETNTLRKISVGGLPGGRRIRYTAIMDAGVCTLTLAVKESRSGLAG